MQLHDKAVNDILPYIDRIVEAMPQAVLVIASDGEVVAANPATRDLLDVPDSRLALRALSEYGALIRSWNAADEAFLPDEIQRCLEGEIIPRHRITITTASGIEHLVVVSATPIRDEAGSVILAMLIATDITEEERLKAYWHAVGTAAEGLSEELVVSRVLDSVLDRIVVSLGGEVVIGIWQLDEATQRLQLMTYRGLSEETVALLRRLSLDTPSSVAEAARAKQTRYYEDVRSGPLGFELDQIVVEKEKIVSWIAAPLLSAGKLIGAMAYGLRNPRRFYEEDLRAVNTISGLFGTAVDHAELYEESQRGRAQLSAILENLAEGVVVVEPSGTIVLINRVGREIFGTETNLGELTLEDIDRLGRHQVDGSQLPSDEWVIRRVLRGETVTEEDFLLDISSARPRRITASGRPVRDAQGKVILGVIICRDVTELRLLEQTRDDYVRAISHDLRNPLAGISGHTQLLRRILRRAGQDDGMVGKSLEAISANALRMKVMITDLAESARLEAGEARLNLASVYLPTFVQEVQERLGGPDEARRIVIDAESDVPLVTADQVQLERILVNLLSNALKYSPAGTPILVTISRRGDEVVTAIKDEGPGISSEEAGKLFQRYYRVETTKQTKTGLGLGLYISRMLVEAHGGRIWVDSHEAKGSTFCFTLPVESG